MNCPECARLLDEYETLERAHATAVGRVAASAQSDNAREYQRLRARADEARLDSEVARLELEQHRRRHAKAN